MKVNIASVVALLGGMLAASGTTANDEVKNPGLSPVPQEAPIVLVQADAATAPPAPDSILNVCQETASWPQFAGTAIRGIDPGYALAIALDQANIAVVMDLSLIKNITLLEGTKHGEIVAGTSTSGRTAYRYDPTPDYVGDDRAVFMADFGGKHYKIVVNLKVSLGLDYNSPLCPENPFEFIKPTKPSSGASGIDAGFSLGTVSVTFADLPGATVGQAASTTITLDKTAAGNGWFN